MKLKIVVFVTLMIAAACGGSPDAKLEALKGKRDKLNLQIEKLEAEIALSADSSAGNLASSFVSIESVEPRIFSHFIEVQGKLDGDANIAIYPEVMGNIVEVYAKVGQHVNAGQVLAHINDAAYQDQLKSL